MNDTYGALETRSAYTTVPQHRISEHYNGICLFEPIVLTINAPPQDPLAFSSARLAAGEADVIAGRTKPLGDVLDALEAGDNGDG